MSDSSNYLVEESTDGYSSSLSPDIHYSSGKYSRNEDSFLFAIQQSDKIRYVHGILNNSIENIFDNISNHAKKERFYIKAIQNLIKQREYLNLNYQLSNDFISHEEFSEELEKHEDKYLIKIDQELNVENFKTLSEIISKLENSFTEDDVSEIFSLKTDFIKSLIKLNSK